MKIICEEKERNLVVTIHGDIDHHSSEEIKTAVDKSFQRSNAKNIIINFENVDFMDSSGIGMLIGRYKMLENKGEGGKLFSVGMSAVLARLFDISGLHKIMVEIKDVSQVLHGGCV